jgi:hypothetical protein
MSRSAKIVKVVGSYGGRVDAGFSRSTWREKRREDLAAQAAALDRRRAAEAVQARSLVAGFVREMQARDVRPQPLRARVPHTGATYRTNVVGWYIRRNRSLGVDANANYYVLDTAPSVAARLFGVRPDPADPPLIVGVGARDGESRPLEELLAQRVAEDL